MPFVMIAGPRAGPFSQAHRQFGNPGEGATTAMAAYTVTASDIGASPVSTCRAGVGVMALGPMFDQLDHLGRTVPASWPDPSNAAGPMRQRRMARLEAGQLVGNQGG
jgi:hypothetical protein